MQTLQTAQGARATENYRYPTQLAQFGAMQERPVIYARPLHGLQCLRSLLDKEKNG